MTSKHLQWNLKLCILWTTNIQSFHLYKKVNAIIFLNRWSSGEENCKANMKFNNSSPTACPQIVRNSLNNDWAEQTIKLFSYEVSIHIMNIAYDSTHFWREVAHKFHLEESARGLISASGYILTCFTEKIIIVIILVIIATIIRMLMYKQS